MLKILHAADFHLDSPFSGLSAEKAAIRRRELRELPTRLAQLVREEGVDLVLLPGDLFDGERVYPETVEALAKALGKMTVPVFIAPGNHDYYHRRSPYETARWPDNVHIFKSPQIETVELPGLNCVVRGCAFTAPHREDDPVAGLAAPKDGKTHLLCVHGELTESGRYAPISTQSLEKSGVRYAALGHIHSTVGSRLGDTFWAYPGCPEGRGFDECGPKGVLIVETDAEDVTVRFEPTCLRQYRTEGVAAERFLEALPQDPSPDLVRYTLYGESRRLLDLATLTRQAGEKFFYLELRDETTLPHDLWARAEEDSLTGLFLREMKARMDGASKEEQPGLLLAARFGLAALEGGEDVRP